MTKLDIAIEIMSMLSRIERQLSDLRAYGEAKSARDLRETIGKWEEASLEGEFPEKTWDTKKRRVVDVAVERASGLHTEARHDD